jgi:hypothetical protein
MKAKHGIMLTVFLASMVVIVFAAFSLFTPDPAQEGASTTVGQGDTNASVERTPADEQFVSLLLSAQENISVVVPVNWPWTSGTLAAQPDQ